MVNCLHKYEYLLRENHYGKLCPLYMRLSAR
jgi:hypothetical protein